MTAEVCLFDRSDFLDWGAEMIGSFMTAARISVGYDIDANATRCAEAIANAIEAQGSADDVGDKVKQSAQKILEHPEFEKAVEALGPEFAELIRKDAAA